ncbi:hypothetical protein ACLKA7_001780 [Drosophila subpalustris]
MLVAKHLSSSLVISTLGPPSGGIKSTTPRGSTLLDTFASLQVCLLNTGTKSTFSKAGRESIIDVTFASPLLARGSKCSLWMPFGKSTFIHESYKTESLDMDCLLSMVSGLSMHVGTRIVRLKQWQMAFPPHAMLRWRSRGTNGMPRGKAQVSKNAIFALARPIRHGLQRKRRELKEAIKRSKARHFQELCDAADSQPFGAIQAGHEEAVQTADAYSSTPAQPNSSHPLSPAAPLRAYWISNPARRRICPNKRGGPEHNSKMWGTAMQVPSYSRGCSSSYRRCALRVASCFRTVSEDAALVVAGMIPLGLLAAERQTGTLVNRALREETISRWQRKWEQASSGKV